MTAVDLGSEQVRELREKIATGSRILAHMGIVDYLGHISARIPGSPYVLIRARGAEQGDQRRMTPDDIALVDLEAKQIDGPRCPDETALHTEIYKVRPDVAAIAHTHQPIATIFGDLGRPILPMQGLGANLCLPDIPIYPSARKITTSEQGADVARTLGHHTFLHLRNHGLTFVGAGVEQVVLSAIWIEHQAKITMWAATIGEPRGMDPEEAQIKAKERFGDDARWRYYVSLLDDAAK
jgi:L-ribulose-5-phosphate 4-epimerase